MDDGEMTLAVERRESGHGRVEAELAVEIEHLAGLDGDGRAHAVVVRLTVGHDDVEAISRTALEEHDEFTAGALGGLLLSEDGADEGSREWRRCRRGRVLRF